MDPYTIAGLLLGGLLIITYIILALVFRNTPQLIPAVSIFLSFNGFIAGIRLIMFIFDDNFYTIIKSASIQPFQVVLGGIALCWATTLTIIDTYKKVTTRTLAPAV